MSGMRKFCKRVKDLPLPRLRSALNVFGIDNFRASTSTRKRSSSRRKASRGKIGVQPEVVRRRKYKSGSKSKQSSGVHLQEIRQ